MAGEAKLGERPPEGAGRDAVHVACIPAVADVTLLPSGMVRRHHNGRYGYSLIEDAVGIVDPFLADVVRPGEAFWLCLFPGTVTGMKHQWAHPAFPDETPASSVLEEAEKIRAEWKGRTRDSLLREFAAMLGVPPEAPAGDPIALVPGRRK